MMASDRPIEMFFSVWGACAKAGAEAKNGTAASKAKVMRRIVSSSRVLLLLP
jgi:hypothetical protein